MLPGNSFRFLSQYLPRLLFLKDHKNGCEAGEMVSIKDCVKFHVKDPVRCPHNDKEAHSPRHLQF